MFLNNNKNLGQVKNACIGAIRNELADAVHFLSHVICRCQSDVLPLER